MNCAEEKSSRGPPPEMGIGSAASAAAAAARHRLHRGQRVRLSPSRRRRRRLPPPGTSVAAPLVRPPLPPKPDTLIASAAAARGRRRAISVDRLTLALDRDEEVAASQISGNGSHSTPTSSTKTKLKLSPSSPAAMPPVLARKTKSSANVVYHVDRPSKDGDAAASARPPLAIKGKLVARRRSFFSQLSLEPSDKNDLSQGKSRKSSFTSYIEEEENSQTYLEEADAGLAVTEAALRKLPVGQLSLDQLKPLVTRHRRVSHCLERLRSTAEGDGQDDEDDEGKFDVPAQIFLGKPIRSASESDALSLTPIGGTSAVDEAFQQSRRATVPRSSSIGGGGGFASPAAAFNLFRSKENSLSPEVPHRSPASSDVGYSSDGAISPSTTSLGGVSSTVGVRAKVKEFFLDSFGKGRKKATVARPLVTRLLAATPLPATASPTKTTAEPFFLDKAICQRLVSGDDEEPIDPAMFEATGPNDGTANRASVASGASSSSSSGDSGGTDAAGMDDLSPEARQAKKVFNIAREIATSERAFVDVLVLLNNDFREFVSNAAKSSFVIPEDELAKVFSNLLELQILNSDLLKDFQSRIENWDQEKKIADIIVKKGAFLKLYTTYVQNFNEASSHYFECLKNYESFANVVRDFEKKPSCKGLKIEHFLLKPVQRLPQYKLLLETYLKNLSPDAEDYQNALEALDIVTKAAAHANEQMKQTDNFKKLLTLQTRLGVADLVQANRELIKEGEIQKISRAGIDVRYLILCSDYLIYAKAAGALTNATGVDGALRVTYRIPLASLEVVEPPTAAEYALDFSIISPVRSCTFRASTSAERTAWVAALKRTAAEARRRRATFATAAGGGERRGGGALGAAAPVWVPDERVTMCQRCHHDFSLLVRRHHCRACGKVICALCSANRAPLEYRNHEPSRVCDLCYDELIKDESLSAYRGRFKRENMPVGVRGGQGHGSRVVPARLKAVAAGDATAQMSGYLHRSKGGGAYKRCWFVLKDHVLYSYRAPEDTAAVDTLPVLGFDLELITTVPSDLSATCSAGGGFRLKHVGNETLSYFAESSDCLTRWTEALTDAVSFG